MAIWLGKNELGQTDKAAVEHSRALHINVNVIMAPDEKALPGSPVRHVDAKRVDPPMLEGEVIEQQADEPAPAPAQPARSAPLRPYPPVRTSGLPDAEAVADVYRR